MTWTRHARAAAVGALAVSLATGSLAAFQSAPASGQPTQIRGRVRNASDDKPVARARVLAIAEGASDPHVAISNPDGTYTIADLPAGAYTITATRTGFAPFTHGQGRDIASTPVTVAAGQQATVDIALVPGRSIAGRILDEDGTPFAGAIVEALVSRFEAGMDRLVSVAVTETNDRGEFRLFGLPPGQYYVSAADPAFRNVNGPSGVLRYSPTYYPGVPFADQARAIAIGEGRDAPSVEFPLKIVRPARLSGQLAADDGKPLLNGAIILTPREGDGVPMVPPGDPELHPDGRFAFPHVVPGRYLIRARGHTQPGGPALFAEFSVEVLGADVNGIMLSLKPGAIVDGTVKVEPTKGSKPPAMTVLRVRAPFSDGNGFGDALTGSVQADGGFVLRGVMKGAHQLVVDGLPPPWVVKSVVYRGADIVDREIDIVEKQHLRDVRITITDASSTVTGTVHNSRQLPVANAGVLVFSNVPLFWMRTSRRMQMAYTDRDGRFSLAGLPAGEYVAVASLWIDEGDLGRRDRLRALQPAGVAFRLDRDDSQATITLQIASAPSGPGSGGGE
jgi:hypothetical protein